MHEFFFGGSAFTRDTCVVCNYSFVVRDIDLVSGGMSPCNMFNGILSRILCGIQHQKMRDRKFLLYYSISFKAFNNLVLS